MTASYTELLLYMSFIHVSFTHTLQSHMKDTDPERILC